MKQFESDKEQFNKKTDILEAQEARKLQVYQAEQVDYDKELAVYTNEVTTYREHVATAAKKFENDMNKVKNEYDWLSKMLQNFKANYNEKFGAVAPKGQ